MDNTELRNHIIIPYQFQLKTDIKSTISLKDMNIPPIQFQSKGCNSTKNIKTIIAKIMLLIYTDKTHYYQCWKLTIFAVSKYLLPGIKVVAKLTYPVANIGGLGIIQLPSFVRCMTKHNVIWSKALIMPLTIWNCVLSYQQNNNFSENWHVLPRNYFHNRIPRQQLFTTNNLNR